MPDKLRCLNGNTIKIIALISMTLDHIGLLFFPEILFFRIIGRLAFPLFAFMVADGCFYTHSRKKYALLIGATALLCQIVYYIAEGSLYMCVLVDFLIAILIIYCLQNMFLKGRSHTHENAPEIVFVKYVWIFPIIALAALTALIQYVLPKFYPLSDLCFDYGFFGVMLPVAVFIPRLFIKDVKNHLIPTQCIFMLPMLIIIAVELKFVQWASLFSIVFILMYNGQRGRLNLKYLFYIYYPLHLGILYLLSELF